jgi:DNA polymerase-4
VGLADLGTDTAPAELFAVPEARALAEETAVDALRLRFGDAAVVRARTLMPRFARSS